MNVWGVLGILVAVGCGGAAWHEKGELRPVATSSFIDAVARHDAVAIADILDDTVIFAGMFFADPACVLQFPVPSRIVGERRRALATCLAALPLRESSRRDPMFGVSVLEYEPGIELEAVFRFPGGHPRLAWLGYSGRRTGNNALPTVTPAAFRAHLVAGDPTAAPTGDAARAIDAENQLLEVKTAYAWVKVCIDGEGTVSGVHAVEVTSPKAEAAFTEAMQQWKFRPFTLGTQATPVCSLIYLDYPSRPTKEEGGRLPIAFTPPPGALRVPQNQVKRISGERAVQPSHRDRLRLMQSASGPITGSYWYCFDTTGNVIDVGTVVPTGLPDYDARLRAAIAKWKFRPYVLDGTPRTGCSAITFIYGR